MYNNIRFTYDSLFRRKLPSMFIQHEMYSCMILASLIALVKPNLRNDF